MTPELSPESIVTVAKEQLTANIGEEFVILNMKNEVYYGLQGVGMRVWQLIQKPQRVADLREALLEEFDVEPARCERDLLELLTKLLAEGMIELQAGSKD
jgi:O-acetyl-ADP-ribose deacetylase (regulator of RNase III)